MQPARALAALVLASIAACGRPAPPATPASPPACAPRGDAEANVVQAIADMYAALKTDDLAGFQARTTPDFYAFEIGQRMDGDTLSKTIAEAHAKGRRHEWSVTQPTVHVDCNLAVITYVNVGAIGDAAGMKPISWLESAALSYSAGTWRIRFFHSTRVPQS